MNLVTELFYLLTLKSHKCYSNHKNVRKNLNWKIYYYMIIYCTNKNLFEKYVCFVTTNTKLDKLCKRFYRHKILRDKFYNCKIIFHDGISDILIYIAGCLHFERSYVNLNSINFKNGKSFLFISMAFYNG